MTPSKARSADPMIEPPAWLDELSLEPGPPWLTMSVHNLEAAEWLIVDDRRDAELSIKRGLLAERHDEVFRAMPGTEDAGAEVLELVQAWLAEHHPSLDRAAASGVHPLDAAARLVQEDLNIVAGEGNQLVAAAVCAPSYWRVAEKVGRPMLDVHGPVAHYADELAAKVDRFLERLPADRLAWRRNWSIHDDPMLFLPAETSRRAVDERDVAWRLWLRSERQTLRRLPGTGAILFTIRTQQTMVGSLATRPDVAGRVASSIRGWSPELAAYKGAHADHPPLLSWLDRVVASRR
jgi:hypothetical protein